MPPTYKEYTSPLVGQRVRVVNPRYYSARIRHQEGVVRATYEGGRSLAIELLQDFNDASKYGYFYLSETDLEFLPCLGEASAAQTAEKGERTMPKFTNYLNVAVIQFLNDNRAFHTIECANYEPDLMQGDLCVVATASHGLGLAEVVEIKGEPDAELRREIVAKVFTPDYDSRVETRKKAAELKAKMQERAKQLQDIVLFQTLAEKDPSMAALLAEFQTLPAGY